MTGIINYFLEQCSNKFQWKYGEDLMEYCHKNNIYLDEVSYGIYIKYFEFNKKLDNYLDLIEIMKPKKLVSLIFVTNLIHNLFGKKKVSEIQTVFNLCEECGIEKDSFFY